MEVIERDCRAHRQLIEDVLDVSRIVSGKLELSIRPTLLSAVINDALNVVRPAANAKGINLESEMDPEVGPISCDARRMQQVVWNLLANSVKFSPMGATVRVTLTRVSRCASGWWTTGRGSMWIFCRMSLIAFARPTAARGEGWADWGWDCRSSSISWSSTAAKWKCSARGWGRGATFTSEHADSRDQR